MATTRLDGRAVAVIVGLDHSVQIADLATGQRLGEPLHGHKEYLRAVATTQIGGRPVAVTGSNDGSLRLWDLLTAVGL